MLFPKLVLCLDLFKLFAGINEKDIIILLATFLEYKNTGRDARTLENIGRQTDNGIHIVFLFYEKTTDHSLCISSE